MREPDRRESVSNLRRMHEDSTGPELDHIVIAARRREDIDTQLTELGLTAGSGRAIPGTGLSNVVVAVGSQLLEIHYPDGSPIAEDTPPYARIQREALAANPDVALLPVAWLVRFRTEELLREASARVGYPVVAVPAEPPNNAAHLLGALGAAFDRPWLPAFIHWTRPPHLPPTLADDHGRVPNEGRLGLDVSAPDNALADWCGSAPSGVRLETGGAGPLRAWIHHAGTEPRAIGLPPTTR
jgi:hypothetical protein